MPPTTPKATPLPLSPTMLRAVGLILAGAEDVLAAKDARDPAVGGPSAFTVATDFEARIGEAIGDLTPADLAVLPAGDVPTLVRSLGNACVRAADVLQKNADAVAGP